MRRFSCCLRPVGQVYDVYDLPSSRLKVQLDTLPVPRANPLVVSMMRKESLCYDAFALSAIKINYH
jgi:hypothetical protein